jgi:hypothetical protein
MSIMSGEYLDEIKNLPQNEKLALLVEQARNSEVLAALLDSEEEELPDDPEVRQMVADFHAAFKRSTLNVLSSAPKRPPRKFDQVTSSSQAADIIEQACELARKEEEEKKEWSDKVENVLINLFLKDNFSLNDVQINKITAFAEEYAKPGEGLNLNLVLWKLAKPKERKGSVRYNEKKERFGEPAEFDLGIEYGQLVSMFRKKGAEKQINTIFRAGVLPTDHFDNFINEKISSNCMNLVNSWYSRYPIGEEYLLKRIFKEAQGFIGRNFGMGFLDEKLNSCNSLEGLQEFAGILPLDPESFFLLKQANLLIRVMHILILYESTVPHDVYDVAPKVLERDMKDFCLFIEGEEGQEKCYLNPPRNDQGQIIRNFLQDEKGMLVDRMEVATDPKDKDALIMKFLRKDFDDMKQINDFVRMRMFLTEKDCVDEASFKKAATKCLGCLLSRFTNDYDVSDLSWSFSSGKTNEASTGKHKGLHVNMKFKLTSEEFGVDGEGNPLTKAVDVEVQILSSVSSEEYEEDRIDYDKGRKKSLKKALEMDKDKRALYEDFVLDLVSALHNDEYEFNYGSVTTMNDELERMDDHLKQHFEAQNGLGDKELFPEEINLRALLKNNQVSFAKNKIRLFVLLLDILTRIDDKGELVNKEIIEYLHDYFPGKLTQILKKYERLIKQKGTFKENENFLRKILLGRIQFMKNIIDVKNGEGIQKPNFKVKKEVFISGKNNKFNILIKDSSMGSKAKNPQEIDSMKYEGPVGLRREGNDFYYEYFNKSKENNESPVYSIEPYENGYICYVLGESFGEKQKVAIWMLEIDEDSGEKGVKYKTYPYKLQIENNSSTNIPELKVVGNTPDTTNPEIRTAKSIESLEEILSPELGLPKSEAKRLYFIKRIQKEIAKKREKGKKAPKTISFVV